MVTSIMESVLHETSNKGGTLSINYIYIFVDYVSAVIQFYNTQLAILVWKYYPNKWSYVGKWYQALFFTVT